MNSYQCPTCLPLNDGSCPQVKQTEPGATTLERTVLCMDIRIRIIDACDEEDKNERMVYRIRRYLLPILLCSVRDSHISKHMLFADGAFLVTSYHKRAFSGALTNSTWPVSHNQRLARKFDARFPRQSPRWNANACTVRIQIATFATRATIKTLKAKITMNSN